MQIKDEFRKLIPPLSVEEFKQLEANCLADGIRDAILTWNGFIIDGHNRYEIAQKHGLTFKTESKEFESELDAKEWMINNQFGRRNLSNYQRSVLALELEDVFRAKAKENLSIAGSSFSPKEGLQKSAKVANHIDTRKELANIANVSHDTIAKVKVIEAKATPEVKAQLSTGEISINQAYKEIKQQTKVDALEYKKAQNISILTSELKDNKPTVHNLECIEYLNTLKDNSIDLLITDPPYSTDVKNIEDFIGGWLLLALSKVKQTGRAFICIGAYPIEIQAYLNMILKQDKFILDNPIIWSYKNTLGVTPKMKYNLNYQMILHLYTEQSSELDTSITNEMFSAMEINAPDGRLGNRYHKWQKPDELALRLIRHASKEGDSVVDCFAGTGTFLLMGAKLNRISSGCEIDLNTLDIAKQRGCNIMIGK